MSLKMMIIAICGSRGVTGCPDSPGNITSGFPRNSSTETPREAIGPISLRRCAEPMTQPRRLLVKVTLQAHGINL